MTQSADDNGRKELMKSAYRKIEELRARLAERERREREPVAVIGMGCRFPGGVADPEAFWKLLSNGGDGITEIPADRWNIDDFYDPDPEKPGKMYVRRGGFIEKVREFDPVFFNVSPQEAASMEPQQRMLLEVSWEALENAGQAPDRLAGTATGVYIGMTSGDYSVLGALAARELADSAHGATGNSPSIAAGRLSYFYGLRGPCMAMDTACASALTAIHLAVQSLRKGESKMALAGSVNLIVAPATFIAVCKARMLSPDGKCKSFDAAANGYVRSEGCGILVLKLLSQAQADGDRIMGVIRGTACNQDGRTNGITAPNGNAQREVIQAALAESGLTPGDIDYVETHGTGTSLGDPIELEALGEVFAPGRPAGRKLILGAVKSNIGHLEPAAGIASTIKAILAMQKGQIPGNLHFHTPNPLIPWDALPFSVPTKLVQWPEGDRRFAGVSSFGFSGTNVHVVLEQAPPAAPAAGRTERPCHLLTLSAQAPKALTELAASYAAFLDANPEARLADVCFTANTGRARFPYRMAVAARSIGELKARLEQYACQPASGESVHAGRAPVQPPQLGMLLVAEPLSELHRELYGESGVFKAAIDACDSMAQECFGVALPPGLWTQPASAAVPGGAVLAFALCHAMAAQWREWGIEPAAVGGSGAGACVAAVVAGAISLRDGLRMAVDPRVATGSPIEWSTPRIPLLSPVTGTALTCDSPKETAEWLPAAGDSADLTALLAGLRREGARTVLAAGVAAGANLGFIAGRGADWAGLLDTIGELFTAGLSVDWQKMEGSQRRERIALPTYPFQRQECWMKIGSLSPSRTASSKEVHPLLGRRIHSPQFRDGIVFEAEFTLDRLPFIKDHRIFGLPMVPAAAMLEMANAAGRLALRHGVVGVDDFLIEQPLVVNAEEARLVQTVLTPEGADAWSFAILSADADDDAPEWKRHCSGTLVKTKAAGREVDAGVVDDLKARYQQSFEPDDFYAECGRAGVGYGPSFRLVRACRYGGDGALALLQLPPDLRPAGYGIYPGLLDSTLQAVGIVGLTDAKRRKDPYVPIAVKSYRLSVSAPTEIWCHAHFQDVDELEAEVLRGDVRLYSGSGERIGELLGIQFKRNLKKDMAREMAEAKVAGWLFEPTWEPLAALSGAAEDAGRWLIVSDNHPVAAALADEVRRRRGHAIVGEPGPAEHCDALLKNVLAGAEPLRGMVYFATAPSAGGDGSVAAAASAATKHLLELTQALARILPGDLGALALVTEGFQAPGIGVESSLAGSAAWGLGRVIAAEMPGLHCKLVDLEPGMAAETAAALLADELFSGSDENQVALGDGRRVALRLTQPSSPVFSRKHSGADSRGPVELGFDERGDFRNLRFKQKAPEPPGPHEVQLRVLATALNFRDVLNVLGMYPGDPGPFGVECVGEIVALGSEVAGWSVGQRVLAVSPGGYRTFTNVPKHLLFPCPPNLSVAEAGTLLIAFLTTAYALCTLGGMKAGHRVLIHAGAGGVGLAALQLAQRAGAEVFATAGSPAKREYLRQLGVQHVMDSRSLHFASEIRELTGGEGVDLVLNSLTGPALTEGLSLVRPGGHFLEIGKNELLTAEQVGAVNAGAHYHVIDFLGTMIREPEVMPRIFAEITDALATGVLRPLPYRTFDLPDALQAFRYMAAARHVGKIIVVDPTAKVADPGGDYLITGGLGGLGLLVARWMGNRGARRVVLVGRKGPNPETEAAIREIETLGVKITVVQADMGDREQVARLLAEQFSPAAPLRGIVHAAGVLDDGVLLSQDWPRFARVLRPKIDGAWNLHELTLGMPLEFFVMFSSGAGLLGNAGQSSYAAGNVFLDTLALARQAGGLPALSIDWGAWGEVGMAAAMDERHTRGWDASGAQVIEPEQGLAVLEALMAKNQIAQMAVLPFEKSALRPPPGQTIAPLFRKLVAAAGVEPAAAPSADIEGAAKRLRGAPEGEKRAILVELICEVVLDTFGLDRSRGIPPDQNLTMLGMDSLLAIQLSNRLKAIFGAAVPSTLTFQYPTIEDIAGYLLETLPATAAPAPQAGGGETGAESPRVETGAALDAEKARALLANLDKISDAEVEALLGAIETETSPP